MYQKIIDHFYRYPRSNWRNIQRFGGVNSYLKMQKGKAEMKKASHRLPPVYSVNGSFEIYFLTGEKYFYQTLFCASSLLKVSKMQFQFILVDDGSFDCKLINRIKMQMPGAVIVQESEIKCHLDQHLPEVQFPYLHHKRRIYPHIKKLTDIHTINRSTFKLVLDSDMLFWNAPLEIINWLKNPQGSLYMLDSDDSYGYTRRLMEELAGTAIPDMVNVGAIGIDSSAIDWERLEIWCKTLEAREGTSYFLEQALSAMIIANQQKTILHEKEYIVNPADNDYESQKLRHYVDLSKKLYFTKDWRQSL